MTGLLHRIGIHLPGCCLTLSRACADGECGLCSSRKCECNCHFDGERR